MQVGDIVYKTTGHHDVGMLHDRADTLHNHTWRIVKIYPNEISIKKDLILCEEINLGYKECFHRMDLEGIKNDNTKM